MPERDMPNAKHNNVHRQTTVVPPEPSDRYDFSMPERYVFKSRKGIDERVVREISAIKHEPEWMLTFRLNALKHFRVKPMPQWGGDLSSINFDDIYYYIKPSKRAERRWDDVPEEIRTTFDRLGIPEAEKKYLAGVGSQYESEVVYHSLHETLARQGVVFLDTDSALKQYPDLFRKHFATIIPPGDNKFAALNSAVWSGGSFIYVPPGVEVKLPLQAYFRINAKNMGQFERTLIIADEGSRVHYVEGCTAPSYTTDSLHSAVVEIVVGRGARVRYTTIQNWSHNVYNLVTKRAKVLRDGIMEWIDGNIGCLMADTHIFTDRTVKTIEDIEVGEHVYALTPDFHLIPQKVVAKKKNKPCAVMRLRTLNHREITATPNHPFLVMRKTGKLWNLSWKPLQELKEGDLVAISGNIPDYGSPYCLPTIKCSGTKPIRFPDKTTPDLMWLLGFYIGDGYKEESRVYFAVPLEDPANERLQLLINTMFNLQPERQKGVVVRVNSVDFSNFLSKLGFAGSAHSKRIPSWVYTIPKEQRIALLEGYIAADGYRRPNHKNLSITSVNRALLEDVKLLAISCGWNPTKISRWVRTEKKPLGKEIFGEDALDDPTYFTPVTVIEPAGEAITYDIEVEGMANFIANGLIVHNSKLTMKYPSVYLMEPGARGTILSLAMAGKGQHQDAGGKVVHMAPDTSSMILSKSLSYGGGRTSYRGFVHIAANAKGTKTHVACDALILDNQSSSDTYPTMDIRTDDTEVGHEASVAKLNDEQLLYLQTRGINEQEARNLIVNGFLEPVIKTLPMEYAVELNRLIQMEMEGAVG